MATQTASNSTVYQSGQIVPTSGTYQVAGTGVQAAAVKNEKNIRQLKAGEVFPNYQGRSVAWHLEVKAG